jgi:hypothetical protein
LAWEGGPVELFFYDMGTERREVQAAWEVFAPSFVPDWTVVVFGEHNKMRGEAIRAFTRAQGAALEPVHKPFGPVKAFRYRGG